MADILKNGGHVGFSAWLSMIFGTIISLVGVGVVAVPTGIISASFVEVINEN